MVNVLLGRGCYDFMKSLNKACILSSLLRALTVKPHLNQSCDNVTGRSISLQVEDKREVSISPGCNRLFLMPEWVYLRERLYQL